jgi:subtilase family serine protease
MTIRRQTVEHPFGTLKAGMGSTHFLTSSSSSFIVGCGGTAKPHGGGEETVWNNDPGNPSGSGTGGGFSTIFTPMPLWQAGAPHGPGRMVPDVSANADPNLGYNIVVHGQTLAFGGTSAVAPLYAGLFAALGRKLSLSMPQKLVTPQLWLNQTCFTDIVTGDNGFFRAKSGPDPCTGIGSPIGQKLAALFGVQPAAVTADVAQVEVSVPEKRRPSHRDARATRRRRASA